MGDWATMGDAAFAANLDGTKFDIAGGYLSSPDDLHTWSRADWEGVPGYKLPIWVAGFAGRQEAESCLTQCEDMKVPAGKTVALDMETRVDITYVSAFGAIMQHHGFKVWVYGSASSVFGNPQLNGYWVADYAGVGPFMYSHMGVRATQWTDGAKYDQSTVKPWELENLWV
jgi:hypothetical protein